MASKSFVFSFDTVEVREREFSLVKADQALMVEPKAFRVLIFLLRNPQRLVSKEEILNAVWGDVAVGEGSLTRCIWMLRNALGDDNRSPRYIETVATVGYRFIGKVEVSEDSPGEPEAPGKPNGVSGVETKVGSRKAVRGWVLTGCVVLALCGAGAIWYMRRPLPPPHISDSVQITHDGRLKDIAGTDGSRLYFFFWRQQGIAQVGIAGGEIAPLPAPLPNPWLHDVSQDGTSFLVGSEENGQQSLWDLQVPGGTVRRIANGGIGSAAWSPDGRSLVYSTPANEILMVKRDGTDLRKLVAAKDHNSASGCFTWSPDGANIRFDSGGRIWEMSSDGSGLHQLLPGWRPSSMLGGGRWTPDGKFFLFLASEHPPGGQIWALDERRTSARQKPSDPVQLASGPIRWGFPFLGRDGKKIFASGFILRGEMVRYDSPTRQLKPWLGGISAEDLSYSPDGKSIVYVSYPEGILWRANRDGTDLIQLTGPPFHPHNPRWSPDGTQIVFTNTDFSENSFSPHSVIYIVSSKGGGPRRLLPADNGQQGDAGWSADGRKIIFEASNLPDLSVVDIASGQISTLPESKGIWNPKSSPNGRFIAGLVPGPPAGIRIFDFETQRWSAVLVTNMDALFHTWSRDGKFIYFFHNGPDQGVFRIRSTGGQPERVADLKDMHHAGSPGFWFGLDPTDAPLLLRDVSSADIYALTLEEK